MFLVVGLLRTFTSLFCGCCEKSRCWVLSNADHPHGAARGAAVGVISCYLDCLHAMREFSGIPYSAAVRRAVWSYYQDKCFIMPDSSPAPGAGAVAPDSRKDAPALEG